MKSFHQKKAHVLLLLAMIISIGSACTVQKRVHRKGWFVQWHHQKAKSEEFSENAAQTANTASQEDNQSPIEGFEKKSISADPEPANNTPKKSTIKQSTDDSEIKQFDAITKELSETPLPANDGSKKISKQKHTVASPTRIPTLAWILLYLGLLLLLLFLVGAIAYAIVNLSFIGLPFQYVFTLVAGIVILVLAVAVAMAPMKRQPSSPDPRYTKQEPKREKKKREPLKKGDKIFLGVIAGLLAVLLFAILTF